MLMFGPNSLSAAVSLEHEYSTCSGRSRSARDPPAATPPTARQSTVKQESDGRSSPLRCFTPLPRRSTQDLRGCAQALRRTSSKQAPEHSTSPRPVQARSEQVPREDSRLQRYAVQEQRPRRPSVPFTDPFVSSGDRRVRDTSSPRSASIGLGLEARPAEVRSTEVRPVQVAWSGAGCRGASDLSAGTKVQTPRRIPSTSPVQHAPVDHSGSDGGHQGHDHRRLSPLRRGSNTVLQVMLEERGLLQQRWEKAKLELEQRSREVQTFRQHAVSLEIELAITKKEKKALQAELEAKKEDIASCVICWERQASHVMVPCGHLALCGSCCLGLPKLPKRICPVCRQESQQQIRVFKP